jgi:hypothetical protein
MVCLVAMLGAACSRTATSNEATGSAGGGGAPSGGAAGGAVGSSSASGGRLPDTIDDTDPSEHVTLAPDVVVVRGGAKVVRDVAEDHARYTLDRSASGVGELRVGKVLVLAGIDAGRVTALREDGDRVEVTLAAVKITDVVRDGDLTWRDVALDAGRAMLISAALPEEGGGDAGSEGGPSGTGTGAPRRDGSPSSRTSGSTGGPTTSEGARGDASDGGAALAPAAWRAPGADDQLGWQAAQGVWLGLPSDTSISANVHGFAVTLTASKDAQARTVLKLQAGAGTNRGQNPKDAFPDATNIEAGVTVELHIDSSTTGNVSVRGGSLSDFSVSTPMSGYAEATATAKSPAAQQFPKSAVVKLPIELAFPISIYGLPFYVSLGASFSLQPSLPTKNSGIDTKLRIDFDGVNGFKVANGQLDRNGNVDITQRNGLGDTTALPSPGATAMVFAVQAPRVGFGIGVLSSRAGAYVDITTSIGITIAPGTAPVPCRRYDADVAVHAGFEAKVSPAWNSAAGADTSIELASKSDHWVDPDVKACQSK